MFDIAQQVVYPPYAGKVATYLGEDSKYIILQFGTGTEPIKFLKSFPATQTIRAATEEDIAATRSSVAHNKTLTTMHRDKRVHDSRHHDRVFHYLENSLSGLTADEATELMKKDVPKATHNNVAPVLTAFHKLGIVERIGRRRTQQGSPAYINCLTADAKEKFYTAYGRLARAS